MLPGELDTLNYTQVLFQWHAAANAESYHLQIAENEVYDPFETALIAEFDVETNAIIVDDIFDWGETYLWQYWWIDEDGNAVDTSYIHQFSIRNYPDSIGTVEVETISQDEM